MIGHVCWLGILLDTSLLKRAWERSFCGCSSAPLVLLVGEMTRCIVEPEVLFLIAASPEAAILNHLLEASASSWVRGHNRFARASHNNALTCFILGLNTHQEGKLFQGESLRENLYHGYELQL